MQNGTNGHFARGRTIVLADTAGYEQSAADSQTYPIGLDVVSVQLPFGAWFPTRGAIVLISAVLLSLGFQIWTNHNLAAFWKAFVSRPVLGYGDPWYFLTSAFLWLQGLFYFLLLREECLLSVSRSAGSSLRSTDIAKWVRPVFTAYGVSLAIFSLLQLVLHIPEGWAGAGLQGPFEDISSYGSIAVATLVFTIATSRSVESYKMLVNIFACLCLFAMVIASWSRGTWLTGLLFLLLLAALRLSRRLTTVFVAGFIAVIVFINLNAARPFWKNQPYLARLLAMARFENPTRKSMERIYLYGKAGRMVHERPLVGHGIGSFYLTSIKYAEPKDPVGATPDFAHNVFLQLAAEQGVPIAILFSAMIVWVLWLGIRAWIRHKSEPPGFSEDALLMLGATLALGAYIQTQLTANSLNVYVSNQFFFWFLMAAVLAIGKRLDSARKSKIGRT
jgi:O-antigen ligase